MLRSSKLVFLPAAKDLGRRTKTIGTRLLFLPPETLAELAEETPLGRNGTPEDVAEAVRFLASDRAAFITGQDLPVNGGFLCV